MSRGFDWNIVFTRRDLKYQTEFTMTDKGLRLIKLNNKKIIAG